MRKNMKSTFNTILTLATLMWALTSCADFLDVNDDLNNPSSTAPANMLPGILANSATLTYNAGEISTYYTQQLATQSGVSITRDQWDFRTQTRVGIFRHHYFDVASNANNMIKWASEDPLAINYQGVGKLMMAHSFLTTTDVLGDMPYTEAFTGKDSPKYDTQDVVYEGIGRLLDEAIHDLQKAIEAGGAVRPMTAENDPVFAGDLQAWKSFAHGLKARFLIHQTNVGVNLHEVTEQVDLALANWQTPLYPFTREDVWTRNPWGPTAGKPLLYSMQVNILNSSAPAAFFMSFLQEEAALDPRALRHFEPNANGELIPVESGVGRPGNLESDELPGLTDMALTKDDSPLAYMTEAELHFIKAEASLANSKNDAYSSYIAGIVSDLERLGVSGEEQAEYLSNPAFVAQSESEFTLSDLITQKFIALYLHPEAWVDMRRHDWSTDIYPGLTRPASVNKQAFGEDKWITRIPYNMETEYIYNLPEIERLGAKDPAFLATRLWWMQ
jgi:hypothetical protein